jgi:hypothetical protein
MSAFTVQKDHIDLLVTAGHAVTAGKFAPEHLAAIADKAGKMLWDENFASVNYRYSESESTPEYEWAPVLEVMDPRPIHWVQVWKAAECYAYQSCEHPQWSDSVAAAYLAALTAHAVSELKKAGWPVPYRAAYKQEIPAGSDVAKWEWSRENGFSELEEFSARFKKAQS